MYNSLISLTVAYRALPSTAFSRLEYWSGLPFPSPGNFPDLGIEPRSSALQADALSSELPGKPTTTIYEDKQGPTAYHGVLYSISDNNNNGKESEKDS